MTFVTNRSVASLVGETSMPVGHAADQHLLLIGPNPSVRKVTESTAWFRLFPGAGARTMALQSAGYATLARPDF